MLVVLFLLFVWVFLGVVLLWFCVWVVVVVVIFVCLFLWVCFVFSWVFSYGINRIYMRKDLRNLTHPAPMGTFDAGLI